MNTPFFIFSTALAGIGGREGDMTSGDAVRAGAVRAGEDSRALREGRDHVVVGTTQCDAVEVPPATGLPAKEESVTPAMDEGGESEVAGAEEKRGTPAMDEGGGSEGVAADPVGGAPLVPVQDGSRQS